MQVVLSSYSVVGISLLVGRPHVSWICWITDLNQIHSRLASWIAKISVCFEKVATKVYFTEGHEVVVPLYVNR